MFPKPKSPWSHGHWCSCGKCSPSLDALLSDSNKKPVWQKTFQAGGAEKTVSSNFDEDAALRREMNKAFIDLCRELVIAGRLKIGPKIWSGDYVKQVMTLDLD